MTRPLPSSVRHLSNTARQRLTIGICREDRNRIWERRAPLTPEAVNHLVTNKNVEVHVEPCDRRIFSMNDYIKAGAVIRPRLDDAHIILSIKETPLDKLITTPILRPDPSNPNVSEWVMGSRTHLMFSHTIKGQPYNTPLLSQFVSPTKASEATIPRLIDYELITNTRDGKRTVAFGWFAGVAGVLESLSSMAHSHLEIGIASPFLYTPRPHTLPSLERLRVSLREIGNWIAADGTPQPLGPFVIGLTGNGNVSQGCLSMLAELPIEKVEVKDLHNLVNNPNTDLRKIYLVHAKPEDYLVEKSGRKYSREHYYKTPESYTSKFAEKIAPYLTLFLNGTGWSPSFPRLMSNEQLAVALERARTLPGARFTNIGDISCDVEGGLEFLTKATTLSDPSYRVWPSNLSDSLPSVQIMSVDILPASIPYDASQHFSKALLPRLESLIDTYSQGTVDQYTEVLKRATIAENGILTERHQWLLPDVLNWRESQKPAEVSTTPASVSLSTPSTPAKDTKATSSNKKKKILMLGSGMVAGPAVDIIASRQDIELMIASDSLTQLQSLSAQYFNVHYRVIDVSKPNTYIHLINDSDTVISLLPTQFHTDIAEICITQGKNMITASYISPKMRTYDEMAKEANILILNEIGLDPGIDHCSAIDLVSRLQAENKEIVSFTSFCGGFPAPEVPHVPLRYKFSWRPTGVLAAALRSAEYTLNGKDYFVAPDRLLVDNFPDIPITQEFPLEGLANGFSKPYASTYNMTSPPPRTIMRGTLRHPGFSALMQSFKLLGLLESERNIKVNSWTSFVSQAMEQRHDNQLGESPVSFISRANPDQLGETLEALEWLGLLPPTLLSSNLGSMPPLPVTPMPPIEIFAYLLAHKLKYEQGERDIVVLSHEVIARPKNNTGPEEVYKSSLITYGALGVTAMARTVGTPLAIAALAVADGKVPLTGVQGPWHPSVYKPVLQGLEEYGLGMTETKGVSRTSVEKYLVSLHGGTGVQNQFTHGQTQSESTITL